MHTAMIHQIAKTCHEMNRTYCAGLGDYSQPAWDDAPQWQRDSAVAGVFYRLENPQAGPEASHNNWMKHKLADGWKFGPTKDPERKEHPCLVEFDQLTDAQQSKDIIFCAVVRGMAGSPPVRASEASD